MQYKKHAFSLVEIIIALAIIVLLTVIGMSANQGYKDNINNTKIISDIETINNALQSYTQENNSLPLPGGNTNFYKIDTSYSHSYEDAETFGVYGSITEDTLPKKYLDVLPLDPRTNSYYSYGKTKGTQEIVANQFELASVQSIDGEYEAKVSGNYTAEAGPYNLIREYNGSNFVYDKSKTNLPYNPEELILIAKADGIVYREGDTIEATSGDLEIYFSDGSVSVLEDGGELTLTKLSFPNEDNLNTLVKLSLGAGTIWTKATHLNDNSKFEVYTTDSTAAVRGTIFGVKKDAVTEVIVIEGEVEVYRNDDFNTTIIDLRTGEKTRIIDGYINGIPSLKESDYDNIKNNFIVKADIRGADTVAMINQEIMNAIPCTFIVDGYEMCDEELSGMELVAYAPYNDTTANSYEINSKFLKMSNEDNNILVSSYFENWTTPDINSVRLNALGKTGVFIDVPNNDDYIKYDNLDLEHSENFAIEINVKVPTDTSSDKHYLIHSNTDIKLYTQYVSGKQRLFLNPINAMDYIDLDSGIFNKIIFENNSGVMTAKKEGGATTTSKTLSNDIDFIYVGSSEVGGNYYGQINDIIDYIKIYKD